MEKVTKEYVVLTGCGNGTSVSADLLSAKVTEHLELGWKLRGKLKCINGYFAQVMVKKRIIG